MSQFFDLKNDPFELDNRINDPDFADQVANLQSELSQWVLFDSPSRVHLWDDAPVTTGAPSQIESTESYYRSMMAKDNGQERERRD